MVKSAIRQLETPEEPSLFIVKLYVRYLSSTIETKEELDPNIFWSKETILLQPRDGKEEHTDVSSLVSPLFLDMSVYLFPNGQTNKKDRIPAGNRNP